ncbi:hypothetical protein ACWEFL_33495 [Streptomyces sp. NPDC004838]
MASPGDIAVQAIHDGGRFVGAASFTLADRSPRAPFHPPRARATHYIEWSRGPGGIRVARRDALPATSSGGTFLWSSHGRDGGFTVGGLDGLSSGATGETVGRFFGSKPRDAGFTGFIPLSCTVKSEGGPRAAPQRTVRQARDIADATGLDVFVDTGGLALPPTADDPEAPIHLLVNPDGSASGWLRVVPAARSGPPLPPPPVEQVAPVGPTGQDVLPGNPWSVSGWRIPGEPDTVRFAPLYAQEKWRAYSYQFEADLARDILGRPQTRAALVDAVTRLHARLTALHGRGGADLAFGFASPTAPGGRDSSTPVPALETFLAGNPGVGSLMSAFATAAYGTRPTCLANSERGRIGSPHPPHRRGPRGAAHRMAHDGRGFRYVGGTVGPALWLLQAYRVLDADPARMFAFRSAVLAWSVAGDHHSLSEVLRASHLAGIGTDEERTALSRDGARLHLWARRALAPYLPTPLPHHAVYHESNRYRSNHEIQVPEDIAAALSGALNDTEVPEHLAERTEAAREWLERFGDAGRRAMTALSPGHLTALFRYSASDHGLFKTYVVASRFGTRGARGLFRGHVWRLAKKDALSPYETRPELLHRYPELDDATSYLAEELEKPEPERDSDTLADLRRDVDRVADRLFDDMALHVDMVTEALESLPPVAAPVWWGGWLPGAVDAPGPSPLLHDGALFLTRFRSTTERPDLALSYAGRDADGEADRHPVVGHLPYSSAPLISPFSLWPNEKEVLYPPGRALTVVARDVTDDWQGEVRSRERYARLTLVEQPAYPPRRFHNADPGPLAPVGSTTLGAARTPVNDGELRRTGDGDAVLDGTRYPLRPAPAGPGRAAESALLAAFGDRAPLAGLLPAEEPGRSAAFRDWLADSLHDDHLSDAEIPPLDRSAHVPLSLLEHAGHTPTVSQRAQAGLLGDRLPVADLAAGPAVRLRLLLADPLLGGADTEPPLIPLLDAAARALGVTAAVAEADGTVTFHGATPDSAPAALLVRDGDQWLAGVPSAVASALAPDGSGVGRLDRAARAVDAASPAVRRRLRDLAATHTLDRAPAWIRGRVRYLEEAETFEKRLGHYLADHPGLNDQIGVMTAELFRRADAAGRWRELGSDDPTVDGAVGVDRDRIEEVAVSGNLRERLAMLWTGLRTTADLLGLPLQAPPQLQADRAERRPAPELTAYEELAGRAGDLTPAEHDRLARLERALRVPLSPERVRPPLSDAERALMPDGVLPWIPGAARYDIPMSTAVQSTAQVTGGLVRAGTSGTTYLKLGQAARMREQWGLDIDLGLVRLALMAEMLPVRHHSLHEIMRGSQLVLDDLRAAGAAESPTLDYADDWNRYRSIAPLTEEELRARVARDGLFPDEHALVEMGWPDEASQGQDSDEAGQSPDPDEAAWLLDHRRTMDDVLGLLVVLGPAVVPDADDGPVTPDLLRQLIADWFLARGLVPSEDPDQDIDHMLDDHHRHLPRNP